MYNACLLVCFSVRLYPINVKPTVTDIREGYGLSKFKNLPAKF